MANCSGETQLSTGAIAGIVVAGIVGFALLVGLCAVMWYQCIAPQPAVVAVTAVPVVTSTGAVVYAAAPAPAVLY